MAPLITLYILAACVAVAAGLFIVMIVLSAVRPPRLPDVPHEPEPPLQRVIRALTPPPIAMATAASTPPPMARVVAPPPIARVVAPPVLPQPVAVAPSPAISDPPPSAPRAAAVTARPAPTTARPAPTTTRPIKPSVTLPAHLDSPRRFIPLAAAPAPDTGRRAVYPIKRTRAWPRIVLGVLVMALAAAGVVIAYPQLLDPLCDDYAWFGDDAVVVVRDHARDARAMIVGWLGQL